MKDLNRRIMGHLVRCGCSKLRRRTDPWLDRKRRICRSVLPRGAFAIQSDVASSRSGRNHDERGHGNDCERGPATPVAISTTALDTGGIRYPFCGMAAPPGAGYDGVKKQAVGQGRCCWLVAPSHRLLFARQWTACCAQRADDARHATKRGADRRIFPNDSAVLVALAGRWPSLVKGSRDERASGSIRGKCRRHARR